MSDEDAMDVDPPVLSRPSSSNVYLYGLQTSLMVGELDSHILGAYYDRLFPSDLIYEWLSYGDPEYFARREISYAIHLDGADSETIIRFLSFGDLDSFRQDIKTRVPIKIDYGAIYTYPPKNKASISPTEFIPIEKELVFDIDANDYDDVRICKCKGSASVCSVCWPLMETAAQVIDTALRAEFGFEQIAWIFSGRRGIHCWVCDPRARKLSQDARAAVATFLAVITSETKPFKKELHPSFKRAYEKSLMPYFEKMCNEYNILEYPEHEAKVLSYAPDKVRSMLAESWKTNQPTSEEKWKQFKDTTNEHLNKSKRHCNPIADVVFFYSYPRLDIQVSKQFNHLLKSPFVIHPGTGKVCVPLDPSNWASFDPDDVPTVQELINAVDSWRGDSGVPAWQKTRLKPYIEKFRMFVKNCRTAAVRAKREAEEKKLDF